MKNDPILQKEVLDELFDTIIDIINTNNYIIDKNEFETIVNGFSRNIETGLPIDEEEAYIYILNINKTLCNTIDIILARVLEHTNIVVKKHYKIEKIRNSISSELYGRIINSIKVKKLLSYNKPLDKNNLSDYIDIIISKLDEGNNEIESDDSKAYFPVINKTPTFKSILKSSFYKIKQFFTFNVLNVLNDDSVVKSSKTKITGDIFGECVDYLKYALDKLNGEDFIGLFKKYNTVDIFEFYPKHIQKLIDNEDSLTLDQRTEIIDANNVVLEDLLSDVKNIGKVKSSIIKLDELVQVNCLKLITNYISHKQL